MVSQMAYTDQTLVCRDCSQNFTFTSGEQEFFASRGLTNAPSRCPECRASRKATQGDSRNSGGYSSGGGGYERQPREMHPATCSACGQATQVPFLPRGDKPVYCS